MTREEAVETLMANYPDACFGQLRDAVDMAISALKQPEIIRCKDCRHRGRLECPFGITVFDAPKDDDFLQ